jgi:hypothetical protein
MATPLPEVQIPNDVLADAHQLRELLVGISALLQNPSRLVAVDAARIATLEARAVADRIAAMLDAIASHQRQQLRCSHEAQLAKHVSSPAKAG